ncbi:MAG: cytochrome c biogenesis protein CcsA [Tahibacter sp.]
MPNLLFTLLATLLYLGAAFALARTATNSASVPRAAGLWIAGLAVAIHGALIASAHGGGLDLHFFAALSLVALLVAAGTLAVNLARPVAALGIIVFPLAALLLGLDSWLAPPTHPLAFGWQIKLHVVVALLAYAVLSVASVLALLLAAQERALRNHRLGGGFLRVLPPLTLTESLMFRLIAGGFVLLSLTLLSGALFVDNMFAQHIVHKTVLSIIAWLVFGALLFGRWRYGWRGRRAVRLMLLGMGVLLLAFFGSKFVLELVLRRAA